MTNPDNPKTFKIGLCMAGAISAGAYTAGVMDYLIEALDEWQKRKDGNVPGTPNHNVELSIIGGASAGGMTGIIAASALQDALEPVRKLEGSIQEAKPENKLYSTWVDLACDDMMPVLLDTGDISKNGLLSILNSEFIDDLAEKAVAVTPEPPIFRKYISKHLKLFVSLNNLEGMEDGINFHGAAEFYNRHLIKNHSDYACFKICESQEDYTNDGWIPLNFKSKLNITTAKNAAMATGAYAVGLQARTLSRSHRYMNDNIWFSSLIRNDNNPFGQDPYDTVNVDGGMINNEPFEKIRDMLIKESLQEERENHQGTKKTDENIEIPQDRISDLEDHNKCKGTVILIDPFPSEPVIFDKSLNLMSIIKNTLMAMKNQARVKSSVIIEAMNSHNTGQYLISPVRYVKYGQEEKIIAGEKAIACGSLSGFGGFLSKEFRVHDYFLGRANCEKFLRDYFTIPADTSNEIFLEGYKNIDKSPFTSDRKNQLELPRDKRALQIIPIFTDRPSQPYLPQFSNQKRWPSISPQEIWTHKKLIQSRAESVLTHLIPQTKITKSTKGLIKGIKYIFFSVLIWIVINVLKGCISNFIIGTIQKSLMSHKLLRKK